MNLSQKQILIKKYIIKCLAKEMTTLEASLNLSVSQRCIQQRIYRYKEKGESSLIHGNVGKIHNNKAKEALKEKIKKIFLETRISGVNPYESISYKYFTEILFDNYQIKVSISFVKKILNNLNYFTPNKHRIYKSKKPFLLRERKHSTGELIQADGSSHNWFINSPKKYVIQGFVDDATGYPTGLYMTKNECLLGYIEAFRNMASDYGLPEAIYPDRAGVFFVSGKSKSQTQFGKMMSSLGVDMFPAYTPQAKGRIERFWGTIKQRLPVLFALKNIDSVEKANIFLRNDFPKYYKKWFPVSPKDNNSLFVKADMHEINNMLKVSFCGRTNAVGVFTLMGYKFCVPELPSQMVRIYISERKGLWITQEKNKKEYKVKLVETDTTGQMPEVYKILIEKIFLANTKAKYRETYFEVDEEGFDTIIKKKKKKKQTA